MQHCQPDAAGGHVRKQVLVRWHSLRLGLAGKTPMQPGDELMSAACVPPSEAQAAHAPRASTHSWVAVVKYLRGAGAA